MASPELCQGMCCICFGTLTAENTLVDDLNEGRGGVHRGKCAYLAGIVAEEHREIHEEHMRKIGRAMHGPVILKCRNEYFAWLDSLGLEDFDEPFEVSPLPTAGSDDDGDYRLLCW